MDYTVHYQVGQAITQRNFGGLSHDFSAEMAEGAEDYVSICAMCSDSAAAVRWRVRENASFSIMLLRYTCTDSNGTEIYAGVK